MGTLRSLNLAGLALSLALMGACGGGGGGSSAPPPPPPPPAGTEVLLNGGFESDGLYWSTGGLIYGAQGGVAPHGGAKQAWIGGYGSSDGDTLETEVAIAADATQAALSIWLWITSDETAATAVDTCALRLEDAATGQTLGTLRTFSNLDKTTGWTAFTFDLLAHKGKALRITWTSQESASLQTSWFMDDVSVKVAGPTAGPVVLHAAPTSGFAGEGVLEVLAANAYDASGLLVNGAACADFTRVNGARSRGTLAAGATTGALTLQTPRGSATGPAITVQRRVPVITRFNPSAGPAGTRVVLEGQYFTGVTSLTLNGAAVGVYTVDSDGQITATLPSGAASGVFQATSPGGSGTSATAFTVTAAGATSDYWIDRLHLNQATQSPLGDVPAVAGRDAYLRIFLRANQAGLPVPQVQVTLTPAGGSPETLPVAAAPAWVPTSLDFGSWTSSVNIPVPGSKLAAGVSIQASVNPGGILPEADSANNSATLAPTVKTLGAFRTTLIPVNQGGITGNVTPGNLATWVGFLGAAFPVGEIDAQVGSEWTYNGAALQSDGTGWSALLGALEQKRVAEGSNRYYFGALNVAYSSGVAGLGYVPQSGSTSGRSAIGWDKTGYGDGGDFPWVYAHETGHNLSRPHSPCGGVSSYDQGYPYNGGGIGVWGLDVATAQLKSPMVYKDIMGYCSPNWISDYVFKRILAHREATPQPLPAGPFLEEPCLVVMALETGQSFELGPVLEVPTRPTKASGLAGFRIRAQDATGGLLFDHPVDVVELGCGPFAGRRAIVAALPARDGLSGRLHRLALSEGGAERSILAAPALQAARRAVAAPQARRVAGGRFELTWDAQAFPAAWVRDPATGEILATLQGGRSVLPFLDPRWELRLSDGLKTQVQALPAAE